MEDKINLLNQELEGIVNFSNDNIVVTDGKGVVIRVSNNSKYIYGKDPLYLIGKTVFQLEKNKVFNPSVSAMVLKNKKEVQIMQTTAQGLSVMATGIPIFNNNDKIIRVISFSHDLTEIKQLKEDYDHLKLQMEKYELEIEELRNKEKNIDGILITSEKMENVWTLIQRMTKSDAAVILTGESGVGKSVFARQLHYKSERKNHAFIEVNCGAIPESLFESELFGYESGAFTGASKNGKAGLIELADQGTLFLDEITEIPYDLQVKLLKVLEEKKISRIGGSKSKNIDFRLITATNQDLNKMVEQKKFREDLYYRLYVVPIKIPSLRERKVDIYHLAQHYLSILNKKYNTNITFHPTTMEVFEQYEWPGNVRQLENLVERLVATSNTDCIYPSNLPFNVSKNIEDNTSLKELSIEVFEQKEMNLQEALEEIERKWLKRAYRQHKTTYEMADYLGYSQPTVVRRLKKYRINTK